MATIALSFLAFGWSLIQNFAPIDDVFLVVKNLTVRGISPETLRLAWTTYDPELYVPLTMMSFQLNYLIAGVHPWIYHLSNLLLHTGNALLVIALIEKITGSRRGAIAAGLLFAVHPLHTEAVVWVAARKDLLSTFFALLSLNLYVPTHEHPRTRRAYALSILTFACALLSKITPVGLPIIFFLHDVLLKRESGWLRIVRRQLPYCTVAAVLLIAAMGGKQQVLSQAHLMETILLSIKSSMFYLQKILLPLRFSIFYPYSGSVEIADAAIALPVIMFVLLMIILMRYARHRPMVWFGLALYIMILAPTFLHFRRAGDLYFAVDRYAYLPSVGIFLLIAMLIERLAHRLSSQTIHQVIVIILMISTGLSIHQTTVWNSQESLFTHALKLYPNATRARTNLARKMRRNRSPQEAYDLLQEGVRVADAMELHQQLGYLYAETNHLAEAHQEFLKARDMKPGDPSPLFDIASLAEQTGQSAVAIEGFQAVIDLDPSFVIARVHLAKLLRIEKDDLQGAEEQLHEALRWNPNSVEAHAEFSSLLRANGNIESALKEEEIARSIDPSSVPLAVNGSGE
jgi:tetratricopeptide (TPR) repeat protein